jgi:putative ABC transport system permease protein
MTYEEANTTATQTGYGAYAYSDGSAGYNAFSSDKSVTLGVKLILQKKSSVSYGCLDSGFYYTNALTQYILDTEKESSIVQFLNGDGTEGSEGTISSIEYTYDYVYVNDDTGKYQNDKVGTATIGGSSTMMEAIINNVSDGANTTVTASLLGGDSMPTAIYFYAVDFDSKDSITKYLDDWNNAHDVEDQITYTDTVGLIIDMVNTMINIITIALVCFTALSLVVSTVMIGIITYVSVVERVKEIGILRAVGARKKDIKRLFNAETFIIGLLSGLSGILITYILSGIIDLIVGFLTGIFTIAALPLWQAGIMVAISVVLTLISGLIPASAAAKKDPVEALRTE